MAKKAKETNVPLIFSLVFFILTTIAFGVMWYLAYSDIEQAQANEKKAKEEQSPLRNAARDAELKARVYRLYMGIEGEADDKTIIDTERAAGNVISNEVIKINEAMAKKLGVAGASDLPPEFAFWKVDANKKADPSPALGLTDQIADLKRMESAYKAAQDEALAYQNQIKEMQKAASALAVVQKNFQAEIDKLPKEFKTKLDEVTTAFDDRTKKFVTDSASVLEKVKAMGDQNAKLEADLGRAQRRIDDLAKQNELLQLQVSESRGDKTQFSYDEPQGKILRKLPDGVVEINLGSAAGVKPGLTFTVLPTDFPEKGRQSRMRMLRVPDGRGGYKSVESFVPRGSIEVYEVVSPTLSLARIQPGSELDPIRDGVTVGDLIYNSVWRKGVADHIALIGIFDVNGDGIDDIASVVKDLTRMGIPVDAYYDMKTRKWEGQITERTRFIVEGYRPINTATDPHRDEKTKLLGLLTEAVSEGKQKGAAVVDFRDFFGRMGYKIRLDVTDDKINQATAPYLSNVGVGNPIPMPQQP